MRGEREGGGGEVQPDEPSSICLSCKPANRPSHSPSTPRPYHREKIKGKVQEYMCIRHRSVSWNRTLHKDGFDHRGGERWWRKNQMSNHAATSVCVTGPQSWNDGSLVAPSSWCPEM